MTTVVLVSVSSLAALFFVVALGVSRSESLKRRIGAVFRRLPRSRSAPADHYYKPYWPR